LTAPIGAIPSANMEPGLAGTCADEHWSQS